MQAARRVFDPLHFLSYCDLLLCPEAELFYILEPVLGRAAELSASETQTFWRRANVLSCVAISELCLLVCPFVQLAARVIFNFNHSHWVWPLAKGFKQWQDALKLYNIVWIWVEVCFSPMLQYV